MTLSSRFALLFSAGLALASCGQDAARTETSPGSATLPPASSEKTSTAPAAAEVPPPRFGDGARVFDQIRKTLLDKYYREGLEEDDLYRAAARGMLEQLDPKLSKWNKLLTPAELAEMHADLKGEVVGVGVQIDFDPKTGYARVLRTLGRSPAEKAGILRGDVIVAVNGELFQNRTLSDVVGRMRGKVGERVKLSVLRGKDLLSIDVLRELVALDATKHVLLPNQVGYLKISSFNQKVPAEVRAALDDLSRQNATSLVVDLRCNPGGALENAIATASALLAKDAPIVVVRERGGARKTHSSIGDGALLELPLAVLVNGTTGSSPEFITAALVESRHARVVGTRTMGKWTVQELEELPNGYGIKYTVGVLETARGASYEGVGLAPEVEVAMSDEELDRATRIDTPAERLAADAQLRTAVSLLTH